MSLLAKAASEVSQTLKVNPGSSRSRLATAAAEVVKDIRRQTAAVDREAEWQRVHSYIADVLKDTHVLYAKLARLEGDFAGEELTRLERISEAVLSLGNELSGFSKAFYEGKYDMAQSDFTYGDTSGRGGEMSPEAPLVDIDVEENQEVAPEAQEGQEQGQGQGGQQEEAA